MKIQRKWRRAWLRGKRSYYREWWVEQKRLKALAATKRKQARSRHSQRLARWASPAAAAAVMLATMSLGMSVADANNIVKDGSTATNIAIQGNITNIKTDSFSANGVNAFNSFKDFSISNGNIVNLHFNSYLDNTKTATNLLNYVTGGSMSTIDGMLNGIKNGQIGGNMYLLNPSGIMVGTTGVINVGNLTLSASNPLFGPQIGSNSIDSIVTNVPTGDIIIKGRINTITGATLRGVNVTNSGDSAVIQTGATYRHNSSNVDFSDIVNDNDRQYGTKVGVENGVVVIYASKKAENTGTISAHSNDKNNGVTISASDVTLEGNILTGGGSLNVQATDSITLNNAVISTRQVAENSSLDSIKNGVAIGQGDAGDVSLKVNHTTYKNKASIDIDKATVIDASAGMLGKTSGDVSIVASSQTELFAWAMTGPEAKVTVGDAVIKGNNVTIQAVAANNASVSPTTNDLNDPNNTASLESLKKDANPLVSTLGNLRVGVAVTNVYAKAGVTIDDKAIIKADKDVLISTAASSAANSILLSVVGGAGVAFSDAQALTNINSGAKITAAGKVDVLANTINTINISTMSMPVVGGLVPLNMMVSYANMTSNASAIVGAGAEINAVGDLNVKAKSIKDMTVAASASAAGGYFSAGVAISDSNVNANAEIAGTVKAANVAVDAKIDTKQNNTWSSSSVGDGEPGSGMDLAVDWISNSFGVWVKDKLGKTPPASIPPSVGITGAVAITLSEDNATAKITSKTDVVNGLVVNNGVKSAGNVLVTSDVTEIMKTAAIAEQKQREENNVLNHPTEANKKAAGVAAAVIYGSYNNNSQAYIGDNAVVDAKQKVSVNSTINVPFVNNWANPDLVVKNIQNAFLSSNLGLDKAMFSSWAQASSDGDVGTASASVDIMNYKNDNKAYIGKGALINQDATFNTDHSKNDVSVTAKTDITTLDLAGMMKSPLDDMIKGARDKTSPMVSAFGNTSKGSGIGGSVLVTLEDNSTKAYIDAGSKIKTNDLTVDAATNVKNISIGVAGGKADKVGFNGTATANIIKDTTYAQIINATEITADNNIKVTAVDNIFNIDAAGGFTEGGSVGIGVSIAFNDIKRDTQASVSGKLTAANDLTVNAANSGGIITASMAGSVTKDNPPAKPTQEDKDKDPVEFIGALFGGDLPALDPLATVKKKLSVLTNNNEQPQAGISVAGNVSINLAEEKALAFVGDNSVAPVVTTIKAKTSNIGAKNDTGIYAVSVAAALAANVDPTSKGIAGAFMLNKVTETTQAYVNNGAMEVTGSAAGDGLTIKATNDAKILSIAASAAGAPTGMAIAGQVSLNMIDNTTSAYVNNSDITVGNDLTVTAEDNATITAVGGAVAFGGASGFGASIAVNIMDNTTEGYINNSDVNASNKESDISVAASEKSTITAVTAAIGASNGTAVNFSASGNSLSNTTTAFIAGEKAGKIGVDTQGSVAVTATDVAKVTSMAGAGSLSAGGVGFGASTSVIVTDNSVSAYIGDNTKIKALGLNADKTVDLGLTVAAKSSEEVISIAAGGAGGGTTGIAGSVTTNVLSQTSKAYLGKNTVINADNTGAGAAQSVSVMATDTTNVTGLAGAVAIGQTAGVGVGADIEVITTDTQAYIDSGAAVKAKNNVIVSASSLEKVNSFVAGVAGGGNVGAAGAASVQIMNTKTYAHIGSIGDTTSNGAMVTADGSVVVTAKDDSTVNLIAGTATYGGSAGVGASINTNVVTKDTVAYIADFADVQAMGQGSGIAVADGTFAITYQDYAADSVKLPSVPTMNGDDSIVKDRKAAAKTNTVKGVAVVATSQNTIRTVAIGAGASGSVAVTGSASINVVTDTTSAYVGKNAKINQGSVGTSEQSVLVAAGSDYFNLGVDGAVAVSGSVGVGAGAGVSVLKNTTTAYIDDFAQVAAAKDITVKAYTKEEVISIAAALAASGEVGVAGAVGANIITNETKGFIGNSAVVVAQNNLAVSAQDDTKVTSIAGGAGIGIGGAGVGGSVAVTVINKDTAAYIGSNATVDAEAKLTDDHLTVYTGDYDGNGNKQTKTISGLSVAAQSSENITDVVISGGFGMYAGVAGSVAVNVDQSKTQAYIGEGAKINTANQVNASTEQGVSIVAVNEVKIASVSGAVGGGLVGVSGGVDVGIVQNDTAAYLGNSGQLNAKKSFELTAMSDKNIASTAASLSGGVVGVAGSVSVYALGTNLSADAQASLQAKKDSADTNNPKEDNAQSYADGQVQTDKYTNALSSYKDENVKNAALTIKDKTKSGSVTSVINKTVVPGGTTAIIGTNAKINVGKKVDSKALEKLNFTSKVGAVAVGGVAVGGAVGVVSAGNNVDTHIGSGTQITAGEDVTLNSRLQTSFDTKAIAGSAGLAGAVAASGTVVVDSSTAKAYMDKVEQITAHNLTINATSAHNITGRAAGAAASYMGPAIAGTVVYGDVTGSTKAYMNDDNASNANRIAVTGNIDIAATTTSTLDGAAIAPAVGMFAGGASVVIMNDTSKTQAYIGNNVAVQQAKGISIQAASTATVSAEANVIAGGVGAFGASVATAKATGSSEAYTGDGVQIGQEAGKTVETLTIQAVDGATAKATARGGAIGGVAVQGIVTDVIVSPNVSAKTGANDKIKTTGKVLVSAQATPKGTASSTGINAGGIAVGASVATVNIKPIITAGIGTSNTVSAAQVIVNASLLRSGNTGEAYALAAGGGLVGINATVSTVNSEANLSSFVGENSTLTTTNGLDIIAQGDTKQQSDATAVAVGFIAAGANSSAASSNNNIQAYLGNGTIVNGGTSTKMNVTARGTDNNNANAIAGVGGIVAGSAAVVTTSTLGTTHAYLGDNTVVNVGTLAIDATHNSIFNGTVNSINASLLGASGAVVNHRLNTAVTTEIGSNATVTAVNSLPSLTTDVVTLTATNNSTKNWLNNALDADAAAWNISAGAGGLANGSAVVSTINVTNKANVNVNSGAKITTGTTNSKGSFVAEADSNVIVHDKTRINSGGAIAIAMIDSKINVTSTNGVTFANGGTVDSPLGTIKIGTKGDADLDNRVAVDVYGLAGAPAGIAHSNYNGTNNVIVNPGARLTTSNDDIILAAGRDTKGNAGKINANAVVNLWNKTPIPINTVPDPEANVINNSTIDIKETGYVGSARDLYLTADKGSISATYTGIGKDIYREAAAAAASAVSNLFGGGDVNFDIKGGSRSVSGSANVNVDGTVETGIKREQSMTIGGQYVKSGDSYIWVAGENDITTSNGITYSKTSTTVSQIMTDRLQKLYNLKNQYAGDTAAGGAYDAEILFLQKKMVTMGLASWTTDSKGKTVFVPGSSAGSNASSPQAEAQSALVNMQKEQTNISPKITAQSGLVGTADSNNTAKQGILISANGAVDTARTALPSADQNLSSADARAKYVSTDAATLIYKTYADNLDAAASAKITADGTALLLTNAQAALKVLTDQKAEVDDIVNSLNALIPGLSTEIPSSPTANIINVNDVTALRGDIRVQADNLTGGLKGKLNAPGDASITITNNSPNYLTVNNLTIRDGGNILLNGGVVSTAADINSLNAIKGQASFTVITKKAPNTTPSITIQSNFNPDATANKKTIYKTDSSGNVINDSNGNPIVIGTVALDTAPDITLATGSKVSNLDGKVAVKSIAGSIYANGTINAGTVDVRASNGDFIQSYVDDFDHIGGDPSSNSAPGGITANGNIFISARYLNINGLIQSGNAEWTLTLSDSSEVLVNGQKTTLAAARADLQAHPGTVGIYKLAGDYGNISQDGYVSYDAAKDRFVVDGVEVHGGYVQLYGQIINTSNNGSGKVKALDGYGSIKITNNSSKDIVINKLDTGAGNAGVIDITDIQDEAGNAIHTVYKSDKGVLTTTVNNVLTNNSYTTSNGRPITTYNPQAGLYYSWTTGTDASKTESYHFQSNDVFGFEYSNSTVGTRTSISYGVETTLKNGNYLTKGRPYNSSSGGTYSFDSASDKSTYYKEIATGSSVYTKIREWTKRKWWTLGIAGTYYLDYQLVTPEKKITTYTKGASNPIGIEFFGSNSGTVNVIGGTNANVFLEGAINNKDGSTVISAGKDILQAKETLITTKDLSLTAKNIGTNEAAIRSITSGTLNANATNGNINVSQVAGNLNLGVVIADSGTLIISADGDIVNATGGSTVRGKRVDLTSINGAIGSMVTPLVIQTGATTSTATVDKVNYGLKASAAGDIVIENQKWTGGAGGNNAAGDLLIDTVVSRGGDAKVITPGQMIDNNVDEQIDKRTWNQLTNYWDSMQLRAGEGTNVDKQAQTITSYASGKTADYQTYWQLNSHVAIGTGKYTCTAGEQAALQAQGINVAAFEAAQTAKYQQYKEAGVSSWNGGVYSTTFAYDPTIAEKAQLLKGSSWTDRELAISLSPGALKQLTDTNPVIKAPNVKGRNVTLLAGAGIGSNVILPGIDANIRPQDLTPEQKVALAAAERSDLEIVGNLINITQRKSVNIEAAAGLGGVLNAVAGTYAYLGSEKTVLLDQITATGDVRLKVAGSILNGDTSSYNIKSQNVILEAAAGTIGYDATGVFSAPLKLDIDGTLTARAADNISLQKDGNIKLDTIYSVKNVTLVATGGNIQTAYPDDKVSIMSRSLTLNADQVGASAKSLGISLADDGQLHVATENDIYLNNISRKLTISEAASNKGNIDISANQDMAANNIEAKVGSIKLNATASLMAENVKTPGVINLIAGKDMTVTNIQTPGVVTLAAGKNMIATNIKSIVDDIKFTAGGDMTVSNIESVTKNIEFTAGSKLDADIVKASGEIKFISSNDMAAHNIESAVGDIQLNSGGNLTVDKIKAAVDKNIKIKATGNILNGASDGSINLTAQNLDLTAETGSIGQTSKHVTVDATGRVIAAAKQDINLTSKGAFTADSLSSQAGYINVTVADNSNLHILKADVAKGMNLRGNNIALDNVIHTGSSMLEMDISGATKPMAEQVTVNVTSTPGVQFNNLIADEATIKAQTEKVEMNNTNIGTKAEVTNNYYTVVADNNPPRTFLGSDVLLRPLDAHYDLLMDGKNISTNTSVIYAQGGIAINGSGTQDNAVTIADKTINPPAVTGGTELGEAGILVRNREIIMQNYTSVANIVDSTQIINDHAAVPISNSGIQEIKDSKPEDALK